jgi:xanthine dehydrogenase accessory factor
MKHWQELGQILDRVLGLAREGRPAALATVTRIRGSAYRRPGARLLIEDGGLVLGGVSGGCLEEDVRQVGLRLLHGGPSRLLHYETGDDETKVWGLGLGCDGAVDVAVQAIPPEAALSTWAPVRDLLEGTAPFVLVTAVEDGGPGGTIVLGPAGRVAGRLDDPAADAAALADAEAALRSRRSGLRTGGTGAVFAELLAPPPRLLICGAGDDARPLTAFGADVGFRVVVADHRAAHLTAERFPAAHGLLLLRPDEESPALPADAQTYAVVKTHSLRWDTEWVRRLLATDVPYVGILGPRARTERIVAALGGGDRERIFGPVGLDLGADGPEQVAVSVLAELLAVASRRTPGHLRERTVAVHA